MKSVRSINASSFVLLVFILFIIQSCTKKNDEVDQNQVELDKWVEENVSPWANLNGYDLEKTSSGLYYVSIQEGLGSTPTVNDYALVSVTVKKLDGSVFETDSFEVAKANDIFDFRKYYAPKLYSIKNLNKSKFAESILKMKEGEKARILYTLSNSVIIALDVTIELLKVYHTSEAYESELINSYLTNQMQNSQVIEDGIYIKKVETNSNGNSIAEYDRVKVSYMVWYLNNQLMDTNIEDSAKANGIYNPSLSYTPLDVSVGSEAFISGFNTTILNMKYGESAYSVFSSKFGYGADGISYYLPSFCPLKMYVKILPNEIIVK